MANGAELVSITNQYHQAFLTVIVNRLGYNHWIGLFTSDVCSGFPGCEFVSAKECFQKQANELCHSFEVTGSLHLEMKPGKI